MENKQTSVQQLIELFAHNDILDHRTLSSDKRLYDLYLRLKAQAEAKERQQILDAYVQGREDSHLDYYPQKHSEDYYNETYGKL